MNSSLWYIWSSAQWSAFLLCYLLYCFMNMYARVFLRIWSQNIYNEIKTPKRTRKDLHLKLAACGEFVRDVMMSCVRPRASWVCKNAPAHR